MSRIMLVSGERLEFGRPWGLAPAATARDRTTPATGAERGKGRVGWYDSHARTLLLANEARRGRWPVSGLRLSRCDRAQRAERVG